MTRNLLVQLGLATSIILTACTLQAQQDRLLADLYGRGVHAYFVGELDKAHKLLSEAIDQKTQDPRCYYFRGVTYAKMGRPEQANKDFQTGAILEARDIQRVFPVNRSLQRVQGKVRLTLETHRKEARLALRTYEEERRRVRYEALKAAEQDVLRGVEQPAPANTPKLPDDARLDANNPFSSDEVGSLGGGVAKPTQQVQTIRPSVAATRRRQEPAAATVTTTNPVAAQPAAAKPAGANPFGGAPAAAAKPAVEPAVEPGAQAPANPFGAAPAARPNDGGGKKTGGAFGALFRAVTKSLPGGDAGDKPAVDNPKVDPTPKPAPNPGGADPAAKPAANPFGGAAPAAKPAANPFGAAPAAKPAPKPAANPFGDNPNK